jgi:hypothetical protein
MNWLFDPAPVIKFLSNAESIPVASPQADDGRDYAKKKQTICVRHFFSRVDSSVIAAFRNFHQSVVTSHPCERSRSLHIDAKDRPYTDSQ